MKQTDHSSAVRKFDKAVLIRNVIRQIEVDIYERDLEAAYELLKLIPENNLKAYLQEEG